MSHYGINLNQQYNNFSPLALSNSSICSWHWLVKCLITWCYWSPSMDWVSIWDHFYIWTLAVFPVAWNWYCSLYLTCKAYPIQVNHLLLYTFQRFHALIKEIKCLIELYSGPPMHRNPTKNKKSLPVIMMCFVLLIRKASLKSLTLIFGMNPTI